MDNVIWIILASAVFIALAGILIAISGDELVNIRDSAQGLQDNDDPADYTSDSPHDNLEPETHNINPHLSLEKNVLQPV